ncbi:MAG: carboxypeptidase-like regulatory domain-containing protein [Gemmatimonadaceae bacterium]|nr:carboxypeptidase-like regulatory domain-containing protein [Gemmatimonadaceae bacterium]
MPINARRTTTIAYFALLASPAIGAQSIEGVLVGRSAAESQDAVVVATRPISGEVVARDRIGPSGRYRLRVPPERLVIRILRIGYVPQLVDTISFQAGVMLTRDVTLHDVPIALARISTSVRSKCIVGPDAETAAALTLHAQAAFLGLLPLFDSSTHATVSVVERSFPPIGDRPDWTRTKVVDTGNAMPLLTLRGDFDPRRASPVRVLERETIVWLPDAAFFTSPNFSSAHCIATVSDPPPRSGWVGLRFDPEEPSQRFPVMRGVVWMDSTSHALRRVDVAVARLNAEAPQYAATASIEFGEVGANASAPLRWILRYPRLAIEYSASRRSGDRSSPVEVQQRVRIAEWRDFDAMLTELTVDGKRQRVPQTP